MEKGQKVWTLYNGNQFDISTGFGAWIDEYTVVNPDIGEGLMLIKTSYGSHCSRRPDEVYTTKQAAQAAMIDEIHKRVSVALKQVAKIQAEIEAANQLEVTA